MNFSAGMNVEGMKILPFNTLQQTELFSLKIQ